MVYCSKCGHENPEAAVFCAACGVKIFRPAEQSPAEPPMAPLNAVPPEPQRTPAPADVAAPPQRPEAPGFSAVPHAPVFGVDDFTARSPQAVKASFEPIVLRRDRILSAAGFARFATLIFGMGYFLRGTVYYVFFSERVAALTSSTDIYFAKMLQCAAYLLVFCACAAFSFLLYRRYSRGWDPRLQAALRPVVYLPFAAAHIWLLLDGIIWSLFRLCAGLLAYDRMPDVLYWSHQAVSLVCLAAAAELARLICRKTLQKSVSYLAGPALPPPHTKTGKPVSFKRAAWFAPVVALLCFLEEIPGSLATAYAEGNLYEDSKMREPFYYTLWHSLLPAAARLLCFAVLTLVAVLLFRLAARRWGNARRGAFWTVALIPAFWYFLLYDEVFVLYSYSERYVGKALSDFGTVLGIMFQVLLIISILGIPIVSAVLAVRYFTKAQAVDAAERIVEEAQPQPDAAVPTQT